MSFRFAAFDAPTSTDAGTSYSYGGSETPTGCWITMCRGGTSPNSSSDAAWSHGACDGTNEWTAAGFVEDVSNGTARYNRYTRDSVVLLIDNAGNVNGELSFTSFGTGAVTLTCATNAFPAGWKLVIYYWTGSQFECGVEDPTAYPHAVTTSANPQGLLTVTSIGNVWDDTAQSSAGFYNVGFAGWDSSGTLTQGSANWGTEKLTGSPYYSCLFQSSTEIFQYFNASAGALDDSFAVTGRTSTSFTIDAVDSVGGGLYDFGWAVFGDSTEKSVVVKAEAMNATTGSTPPTPDQTYTGYDGTIESILVGVHTATSVDALWTNFTAGAVGMGGGVSDSEEFCQFVGCRDASISPLGTGGDPVGTCRSGHATTYSDAYGWAFQKTVDRRQSAQLYSFSFDVDDEWDSDNVNTVQAYMVVMAICKPPGPTTLWIKGNTLLKGNAALNP